MTINVTLTVSLKEGKNMQNLMEELINIKLKSALVITATASGVSTLTPTPTFPTSDEGQTKKRR